MQSDLRRSSAAVLPSLLLLCLPALSSAQSSTLLSGTVADPTGAMVPAAAVTLTNKTTAVVRSATTDENGAFVFPQIQPGSYDLKAEKTGFKAISSELLVALVCASDERKHHG